MTMAYSKMTNFLVIIHRLSLIKTWRFGDRTQSIENNSIDWAQQSTFNMMTETDFSIRNVVFLITLRR
jgi:hypothetical protein